MNTVVLPSLLVSQSSPQAGNALQWLPTGVTCMYRPKAFNSRAWPAVHYFLLTCILAAPSIQAALRTAC